MIIRLYVVMMGSIFGVFKRAIKSPEKILLNIIYRIPVLRKISDKRYISLLFRITYGRKIDFANPKSFNEKLNWLKLYDRKDLYTTMVDKYESKKYVGNIIGNDYIIPTLGVYDTFDDIDFNLLPEKFVMKCNHDSGNVIICKDKNKLDFKRLKKKMNACLKKDYYLINREWPYKNVKRKIIVEKYMEDKKNDELVDYKIYCFNGQPKYLYISQGLSNHATAKIDFVDLNFHKAPFYRKDFKQHEIIPNKPKNYERMLELAKKLSYNISFIRVDFYEINGKIYFGELTFTPCGGFMKFYPKEWDEKLGDMIDLSEV